MFLRSVTLDEDHSIRKTDFEVEAPQASRRLPTIGVLLTLVWLAGVALYVYLGYDKFSTLNPNEIADFAAGVFAPLAFFWLVLGFFQQGQELRNSGKALMAAGSRIAALR